MYPMLRKLRNDLSEKPNRTREEEELLKELKSLSILDVELNSLGLSGKKVCKECGRSY